MRIFCLILFLSTFAAQAQYSLGGKNEAMGANAVVSQNEWSINGNVSGISYVTSHILSVDYKQSLMSSEIKGIAASLVVPIQKRYFLALGVHQFGIDVFKESRYSLAYAQKFGKLSLAINQNFHQLIVPNYFNKVGYSIDAGSQYAYSDNIILGVYLQNIGHLGYWQDQIYFPSMGALGVQWRIDKAVRVASGFYYPLYSTSKPSLRMGFDYELINNFSIRAGMQSVPFAYHVGFGVQFHSFQFDFAYRQQVVLGGQSQISLAYAW